MKPKCFVIVICLFFLPINSMENIEQKIERISKDLLDLKNDHRGSKKRQKKIGEELRDIECELVQRKLSTIVSDGRSKSKVMYDDLLKKKMELETMKAGIENHMKSPHLSELQLMALKKQKEAAEVMQNLLTPQFDYLDNLKERLDFWANLIPKKINQKQRQFSSMPPTETN